MIKYDKVILFNTYGDLQKVGTTYEIANITETTYVLRDEKTKVAVVSINIDEFEKYFKRKEGKIGWTNWCNIEDKGELIAVYRTNGRKVQVKLLNGKYRSESTCSKYDEFDITVGIYIAYLRCLRKKYKNLYDYALSGIKETENLLKSKIDNLK